MILAAPASLAATPHRAGVIVSDAHAKMQTKCVAFDEHSITGLQLLQRAGFSTTLDQSSVGSAVCSIDGGGCSSTSNCFCHYPVFWGYWTKDDPHKAWRFSDQGAQGRRVVDGALDAWVWGKNGGPAPKTVALDAVCAMASRVTKKTLAPHGNYLAFGGFVAAFAVAGVFLARRRARRSR